MRFSRVVPIDMVSYKENKKMEHICNTLDLSVPRRMGFQSLETRRKGSRQPKNKSPNHVHSLLILHIHTHTLSI